MAISLNKEHLKGYKDIALLLIKHGRSEWVRTSGLDEALLEDDWSAEQADGDPEAFARDLEALGPTYIKLGQMLSTRPDLLPPPYLKALSRLQDQVEPFPFDQVQHIVENELGVRLSKAFEAFEAEPSAAASLGQVHRARLRDGRPVVVKVQRPGIRAQIRQDLEVLADIAEFVDDHTEAGRRLGAAAMLDEFRKSLLRELDYRQEAQNLVTLADNLKAYERIIVPRPVADYSTARVLTMDYIDGTKITEVSPVTRTELDGEALAEELSRAYLDQILVDGFFHADPHPGNVFLVLPPPGHDAPACIALLDLGMVARFDPTIQESLLKLLLAISEGRGREVAAISLELGTPLDVFDDESFTRQISDLVTRFQEATLEDLEMGRIVMELARISGQNGLRPPPEITMLGKTLLNLDAVGRCLTPTFDPNTVVRRHAQSIMQRRMAKNLSPGNIFATVLETSELARQLPARLNTVTEALATGTFRVKVDAIDERRFLNAFHRIANRIAISIVLAALIIGAALLMRVETAFTVFGYPGIAMVLFLIAAACGFYLVFTIFLRDRRPDQ